MELFLFILGWFIIPAVCISVAIYREGLKGDDVFTSLMALALGPLLVIVLVFMLIIVLEDKYKDVILVRPKKDREKK